MVGSITIENFHVLKKLELPELSQFTILTGRNGVGKSSVLYAIAAAYPHDSHIIALPSVFPKSKEPEMLQIIQMADPAVTEKSLDGYIGHGAARLWEIFSRISANPDGIILIDDVETGLHYSVYDGFWRRIAQDAKDCQIIVTTHSYECLSSAAYEFSDAGLSDKLCLYRLERKGEENRAFRFPGDLLLFSVENRLEVR